MITGDIKSQIDRIWDTFWSGGISNPPFVSGLDHENTTNCTGEPACVSADR